MPEVSVVKQPKTEKLDLTQALGFETPLFRNPFALMKQFADDLDRFFGPAPRLTGELTAWTPAIEVKEKEGNLLVTAELPGIKKEDVKVTIEGDALVLEGEKKQEKEEKREGYMMSERTYGKFYRSISLPEGAKIDATAAKFDNGILEVKVPLAEAKVKRTEIPVTEGTAKKAA